MNKHPELVKGKLTSSFTLKDSISMWNEITEILNSVSGAEKDWKSWRKCWHDFQSRSKKKHTLLKQSLAATGGGKKDTEELTQEEEQVLNILCPTSVHGHPNIKESNVNLIENSESDIEMEYLQEHEDDIFLKIPSTSTQSDSNNCTLLTKKRKVVIDNDFDDSELLNEKENINRTQNNNIHIKQTSLKANEVFKNIKITMNANSCEQGKIQNDEMKKKMTTKQKLQNTVEVSTKLNDIYEKTYELKKKFYETRLEYLKRSTEANEKIANILEKCNMFK